MLPKESEPTELNPIAAAAAQVAQTASNVGAPQEVVYQVSGQIFFNICFYIGRQPLVQVVQLRQGLWQIQKEQNCMPGTPLPAKVVLTQTTANTLMQFLGSQPCDDVYELLAAFEDELRAYVDEANRQAQAAAAALALADATAAKAPAITDVAQGPAIDIPAATAASVVDAPAADSTTAAPVAEDPTPAAAATAEVGAAPAGDASVAPAAAV